MVRVRVSPVIGGFHSIEGLTPCLLDVNTHVTRMGDEDIISVILKFA